MLSARGVYAPMAPLHPSVYAAAPETVQAAWREVQDVQTRWQVARDAAGVMSDAVKNAKAKDAENAAKAVAAGKPIPKSLELQAVEAAHEKGREVAALADLADATERAFMEVLREDAKELADSFAAAAESSLTHALGFLSDFQRGLEDLSLFMGSWLWLQGNMSGPLSVKRMTTTLHGVEQQTSDLLAWIAEDLRKQAPSAVLKRREEQEAVWAKERELRQSTDGLLVDAASIGAYS